MANSYYNNALVDGDTMSDSVLEAIESGFTLAEADIVDRVTKEGTPVADHIMSMDASGDAVDSGCTASGGNMTVPGTLTTPQIDPDNIEVQETIYFDAIVDNGNSGASKTINWTSGNKQKITATANCTLSFTAPTGPTSLTLLVTMGGTGSYTFTYPGTVIWVGGSAFQPNSAVSSKNLITFIWDGTNYWGVGLPAFS